MSLESAAILVGWATGVLVLAWRMGVAKGEIMSALSHIAGEVSDLKLERKEDAKDIVALKIAVAKRGDVHLHAVDGNGQCDD